MGWLRRRHSGAPGSGDGAGDTAEPDECIPAEPLTCVGCGRALGFDAEDEPDGDGPGRHLCGECNRSRNFDAELEMRSWHGDL